MNNRCLKNLWLFLLLWPIGAISQENQGVDIDGFEQPNSQTMRMSFHLLQEGQQPVVDGDLSESAWSDAPIIDAFHQTRPNDHGVPTERTEVQVMRTNQMIYVGFKAFDSKIEELSAKGLIQGQNFFSDDRLSFYLDSFNDRRNSYFFQVNANAVRRDALVGTDYFIDDWSTIWYAETRIHDWGWSAEIAIPIKSISFDPSATEWGVNFDRVYPRKGEAMAWSSADRSINPGVAGYIDNVTGFTQGFGLEVAPSVSVGYFDTKDEGSSTKVEPSITSFYNINPFLTAGLTLNTDFSGTDVDDRQVNLSRFSLFFPEKREFFLRDASIFEFGNIEVNGRPFFSRKMGLSSEGDPLDIDAGVKLSGRAGEWNLGALAIKQEAEIEGADEGLFVGRATRNVFSESEVGMIATYGDPTSEQSNSLLGFDYNYRNSRFLGDKQLRANVWYQQSDTEGLGDDQSAFGISLNYPNYKYSGYLNYSRIEENFNPALGFVNRKGVQTVDGQLRYRHQLSESYLQWLRARLQFSRTEFLDGGIQSQRVFLNVLEGFSKGNDFFTFFIGQTKEGIREPFELTDDITIDVGEYTADRYGVFFETGFQRTFRAEVEIADGDFFGGTRFEVVPKIEWRPNKHFFASISAAQNWIKLPQGNFTSRLFALKLNYAFNSKWAWLNVVQADNFSDELSMNSRLRYQPRADREFLLVFNQTRDRVTDDILDSAVILKAAFNFRL